MVAVDALMSQLDGEVPRNFVEQLIEEGPRLWTLQPPDVLAEDVLMCHPVPEPGEVRTTVDRDGRRGLWRLGVVAPDSKGLLSRSAGVIRRHGLSVVTAVAAAWPSRSLAMQRFQVTDPGREIGLEEGWPAIIEELESILPFPGGEAAPPPRLRRARIGVETIGKGRVLLAIFAPDADGLLWSVGNWLERSGCNIELASVASISGVAEDLLVVDGAPDVEQLAEYLAPADSGVVDITVSREGLAEVSGIAMMQILLRSLRAGSRRTQARVHRLSTRRRLDERRRKGRSSALHTHPV